MASRHATKDTPEMQLLMFLVHTLSSSSLQRLEETTRRIGDGVDEIKSFLYRADTGELPVVSAPSGVDRVSRLRFSEKCLEAAEISHRWFMIGIQEWINVGRWWFLRVSQSQHASMPLLTLIFVSCLTSAWYCRLKRI